MSRRRRGALLCAGILAFALPVLPGCRRKSTPPSAAEPAKATPVPMVRFTPMPPPPTPTLRPGVPTRLPSLPD
ncbi:MAG: hypothetical protein ABI592_01555 [Acidobacteriota bacterium]